MNPDNAHDPQSFHAHPFPIASSQRKKVHFVLSTYSLSMVRFLVASPLREDESLCLPPCRKSSSVVARASCSSPLPLPASPSPHCGPARFWASFLAHRDVNTALGGRPRASTWVLVVTWAVEINTALVCVRTTGPRVALSSCTASSLDVVSGPSCPSHQHGAPGLSPKDTIKAVGGGTDCIHPHGSQVSLRPQGSSVGH